MIFKPCSMSSKSSTFNRLSSQFIISSLTRYYSRPLVLVNNRVNCNPYQRNHHNQGNMSNNDAGRINLEEAMEKDKERFLKMDLQSKRKFYAVGRKFVELPTISSWTLFSLTNHINGKSGDTYKFSEKINNKVSLYIGDITALEIDCIVNAANKKLAGGSGVDGAIHRAAGIDLLKRECKLLNGCEVGDAKISGGYRLPAKYVIHTVGPIGEKPELLKNCYNRCLEVMKENNLKSIAFPCISTGAYRYPNKKAAEVALSTVREWMDKEEEYVDKTDRVIFCLFMAEDIEIYKKLMPVYFPTKES